MKKLTTSAEIEALRGKKAKEVFENLVGILGDSPEILDYDDAEVYNLGEIMNKPNDYYLSPDECEIYDLTGGYYMFCDRQNFLRAASKILTALGEDNETLPEFEHTVEIYKIIE